MYDENLPAFLLESLMFDWKGDQKLCDLEISFHGKVFNAHRCVLGAMSQYFYLQMPAMGEVMTIDFHNVKVETFEVVLEYFYTTHIDLRDDNIYDLLYLSAEFKIELLEQMCVTYLKSKITMDTCLDMFNVCQTYQDLTQACFDFISDNFTTVITTKSFLQMHYDKLKHILELVFVGEVSAPSDLDKYRAIKTWILFDINGRSEHGDEFLSLVDFTSFEPNSLRKIFDEDNVLKKCRGTRKRLHRMLKRCRDWRSAASKKNLGLESATVWLIGGESASRELIKLDLASKTFQQESLPCDVIGGFCVRVSDDSVFVVTSGSISLLLLKDDQAAEVTAQHKMRQINSHFAGAMINGIIYAHGGISGAHNRKLIIDDAIVGIDPSRGKITMRQPGVVPARYEHAAVTTQSKLFVFGGRTCHHRVVADGFCFNPKNGSVRTLASMKVARHRHALLVCNDGNTILAIGGLGVDGRALNSVECYDVETDRWRDFPALKIARHSCVVTMIGRNLYVLGGSRSEDEKSWETAVEICRNFRGWSVLCRMPDTHISLPCVLV